MHLFIISRQHHDLYDYLRERLAGDGDVRVIADRRLEERRRRAAPAAAERRRAERRSRPEIDEQLRVRSHAIVTISSEAPPLRDTLQWVERVQDHVAVVRGVLTQHERLRREADAVKREHERLRADAERSRSELEHIDAQLARAIAMVNDLLARLRDGSTPGHAA